jgi:hypothetical protein
MSCILTINLSISTSYQLAISHDDESRLGFETSMTKMTPTMDYPTNNFETFLMTIKSEMKWHALVSYDYYTLYSIQYA